MNYHKYYSVDVVNGPGTRCTLFVAGCEHKCVECYNKSTWRIDSGFLFTKKIEDIIIKDLQDTRISRQGLSISGGDPLHPANISTILKLVKRVKYVCPDKDIWLWTGYKLNELTLEQQKVIFLIDTLIDGKFIKSLYDPKLYLRGSSNQVIHKLR
ncbi:Anaerobic ribonucleoside-triphosphate reductase-activating protein [Candidatus Providencia siddallii]|uniref:Anaerobic ribonucleoside-triphosphate reductase-activating protein n=1 Tax=Candidatus Providencia siddallii TaxID=1715285 RepID=A0A0M6W6H9_9GAMM|nr:Anaerobic ribonucleoside-triphosphate reductase-activating protein [Candidatus Providencia siddallii]